MTRAPRALVTGVGSNIGQGIIKALRLELPGSHIVGTDANPASGGFYACDAAFVLPRADAAGYGEELAHAIRAEGVEIVLAGSHFEPPVLARLAREIEASTNARVVVSPADVVDACVDKWLTVEWLRARGCRWPRTVLAHETSPEELEQLVTELSFPLVVKPRNGQGSRHVHVVSTRAELSEAIRTTPHAIVQEHLGSEDEEYTVAVLSDLEGRVAAVTAMRRVLAGGTTVVAETGRFPEIEEEAARIATAFGLCGPSNVQMRLTARGPVAFEINPRFSGTTSLRALAGWNDAAAIVRHVLYGEPIQMTAPREGRITRHWDEVFVPADEAELVDRDRSWRPSPASGVRHVSLYPPPAKR